MKRSSRLGRLLASCSLLLATTGAIAGPLTSQRLAASGINGDFTQASATVQAGPEFDIYNWIFFDFDEDGLLDVYVRNVVQVAFGTLAPPVLFTDLDGTIPRITGFRLVSLGSRTSNLTDADLSFTDDSLSIDFGGVSLVVGQANLFQVTFAPNAVPEPASIGLLGLGIVAIGLVKRRRG